MTIEEKLRAMLILWHENVLKEREQRLRDGKDKFVDWAQAKKDLKEGFQKGFPSLSITVSREMRQIFTLFWIAEEILSG